MTNDEDDDNDDDDDDYCNDDNYEDDDYDDNLDDNRWWQMIDWLTNLLIYRLTDMTENEKIWNKWSTLRSLLLVKHTIGFNWIIN